MSLIRLKQSDGHKKEIFTNITYKRLQQHVTVNWVKLDRATSSLRLAHLRLSPYQKIDNINGIHNCYTILYNATYNIMYMYTCCISFVIYLKSNEHLHFFS